ncbi:hypothetical protein SAMN05445871_3346 [Paraburkholderia caballeronis]|uniref:Peptide-binding protein n=1 Tax=Paraburkholderia caballeronis TaxID=416943 RepID=A0A1H7HT52_9BURK|nr:hypothetical protein C7403_101300 [Paraburkholderia caballeronis]PXX04706.1 hypothetical protein C7407_101300 [Paraburkholderia caballeronis]RAK05767.1 hypothetical protein C7409_101300 [Paraburkholderia caballeronis]SED02690.1 hypothetical protein SAMN05445871_3346 [Paraburkholderia caballeronis]SEK51365.1 hypothetical protein SAMN05192542_102335 [Paraburkholderia caballeronis]
MHAGLVRIGRWALGAGLAAVFALAHAQPSHPPLHASYGGGFGHGAMARAAYGGARLDGLRVNPGGGWYGAAPRASGARVDGPIAHARPSSRYDAMPLRVADAAGYESRRGEARYGGGITPVSAEARAVPPPPADSPVRAGSIREDVARYNEERASFRPFAHGSADVPRPPMPSPYRN